MWDDDLMIKVYNMMSRQKEEFIPVDDDCVRMYVCGQTVYDFCHLGHARKKIVFDMIRRWLTAIGYKVLFVENITDIDDKIINKANSTGCSIKEITDKYTEYMHEDFDKLSIIRPDIEPKATDCIDSAIKMIELLLKNGFAYKADNGDVYFSVMKFSNYGVLSNRDVDSYSETDALSVKQNNLDFVLWKAYQDGEPYWSAPFGEGRPGWHIECSAMIHKTFGKTIDIHGGGYDLIFPHHENEIAQSESCFSIPLAKYWVYSGFLNINGDKMSKSLGNIYKLRDVLDKYHYEVLRFFCLKTHYRSILDFSTSVIDESANLLTKLYSALKIFNIDTTTTPVSINWSHHYAHAFKDAMNDDFNTPLAIGFLLQLASNVNKYHDAKECKLLFGLGSLLGFFTTPVNEFLCWNISVSDAEINDLISRRQEYRDVNDFANADLIRHQLEEKGVLLEDNGNNTIWRKK